MFYFTSDEKLDENTYIHIYTWNALWLYGKWCLRAFALRLPVLVEMYQRHTLQFCSCAAAAVRFEIVTNSVEAVLCDWFGKRHTTSFSVNSLGLFVIEQNDLTKRKEQRTKKTNFALIFLINTKRFQNWFRGILLWICALLIDLLSCCDSMHLFPMLLVLLCCVNC